ncbi:MAG: hypothetical protein FWE31_03020 [Firmicutes bacterium]|nr:hypothetical protein [Bacillota bacterium]
MKTPKTQQQIQKRNRIILVSSLVVVLLAIAITSLVLAIIPVRHSLPLLNATINNQIKDIGVVRGQGDANTTILRFSDRADGLDVNANAKDEILRLLERGGRTNQFREMFRNTRPNTVSPTISNVSNIRSRSNHQLLEITFLNPTFAIYQNQLINVHDSRFDIDATETHVSMIMIPLNNIRPYWQEQQWFLNTGAEHQNFIGHYLTTRGNFHGLHNFLFGEDAVTLL